MFSGSIPALPTPFKGDGIDEAALRDHVAWLIEQGSSGIAACGTTGEAASLSREEHRRVLDICVSEASGRVPIIAGCGTANTATTLEHIHRARDAGAAAAMVTPPYYVCPGQQGVLAHFEELAKHCRLPIIFYNVPGRTGTDILPETMGALVLAYPQVFIGLKDATGALARITLQREACGAEFCQLSGNDETTLGFMAMGGSGCISVTANLTPRLCADFQEACQRYDYRRALDLHNQLSPLHRVMFATPSPAPLKYALSKVRDKYSAQMRLPLAALDTQSCDLVDLAMKVPFSGMLQNLACPDITT